MTQPEVELLELNENQLRELVNAQATWRAFEQARREARLVRGSMVWKKSGNGTYLIRVSTTGAQTSLGPQDERTQAMFDAFHQRKEPAQQRLKALKARLEEQRKLNRVYRVGRTPTVVVRALAEIAAADMADQFMVIGTHALYAYEMAAGVLVQTSAMATRDLDLLFDARKRMAFATTLHRSGVGSLIALLQKADPSFRVMREQLQTAVNDDGFEIDIIRRRAAGDDPHPMRMSDDENDFWAVQIPDGDKLATGRKFEHLVVAPNGEMASMRTIHPLDFIRLKTQLADLPTRDPQKAPKDRLQAQVVQALWDGYLYRLG
ncbi:MAG: GSU2403 family nucleotidyltransferase fold protein [Ramlibacter sp.]